MKNTIKSVITILSFFICYSCQNTIDTELQEKNNSSIGLGNSNDFKICLDKDVIKTGKNSNKKIDGSIFLSKKWTNGAIVKVKFLNGTPFLHQKVIQYAMEWTKYANIHFVFVPSNENAEIKINFDNSNASWSYMGTDCLFVNQQSPSMNFGWFTEATPDIEFSRVVLHEFGHALGLIHEHQSPNVDIKWNKSVVYSHFALSQGWNTAAVDYNIFNKYSTTQTNSSSYDKSSIMHYFFNSALTLDNTYFPFNTQLSNEDKTFIKSAYPKTTNIWDRELPGYGDSGGEAPGDYDGDGKTDISVHQRGYWYIDFASNGFGLWDRELPGYGNSGGEAPGDYDGDGKTDISINSGGTWEIDFAANGFGAWDIKRTGCFFEGGEAQGDYDGDGKTDICLRANHNWYIDYAYDGFGWWNQILEGFDYGNTGTENPGDYDGDSKTDISIHQNNIWLIDYAYNGFGTWDLVLNDYQNTGREAPGDYDGDGITDIAIYQDNGIFVVDYSSENGFGDWDSELLYGFSLSRYNSGYGGHKGGVAQGDYDGNGRTDFSLHKDNYWYLTFQYYEIN